MKFFLIQLLFLVIAAFLGAYGKDFLEKKRKKKWERLKLRRKRYRLGKESREWLFNYYQSEGKETELYTIPHSAITIPYLTKESWYHLEGKHIEFDVVDGKSSVPLDKKLLKRREKMYNVFDAQIFRFTGIEESDENIKIKLGFASYFQYLTVCGKLEDELYRCISKKSNKATYRYNYAKSIRTLVEGKLGAQVFGFAVATVIKRSNGKLQTFICDRSELTGVAAGTSSPAPTFVCNPLYTYKNDRYEEFKDNLRFDIPLQYSMFEFFEEFYNQEEVINKNAKRRPDLSWFYKKEPIKSLINLHELNEFKFEILGFGFDAYTGEFNVAAIMLIENSDFVESELDRIVDLNWEFSDFTLMDLDSRELRELIHSESEDNLMYPTNIFCLSRTLERFGLR